MRQVMSLVHPSCLWCARANMSVFDPPGYSVVVLDHESLQHICVFFAEIKACSSRTAGEAVPGDEVNAAT